MAVAGRMQKSRAQTMTWKAREVIGEMATSGFTYGKCKGDAKCVLMRLARTYSSRGPDRT